MKSLRTNLSLLPLGLALCAFYVNCSGSLRTVKPGSILNMGTETGNPMIATGPKVFLDSRYPGLSANHRVLTVGTDKTFTDCQAAIDAAAPGDEVVIDAGFICTPIVLSDKGTTPSYVVIRTAELDSLPAEGTRISSADFKHLARIETAQGAPAVSTIGPAHHYQLVGLEIRAASGSSAFFDTLIKFGTGRETSLADLPHDIVVSRSWIHGFPAQEVKRGIGLNASAVSVVDSIVEEIHAHVYAQAIAGWNIGIGPFKIVNNFLSSAGENFFIGGAQTTIPGLIPSDIEFRRNLLSKDLTWRGSTGQPGPWVVDSLMVLSNVQRILIDGNTLENDWFVQDPNIGTTGFALRIRPNSEGNMSWARVMDVTVTNNIIRHAAGALEIVYQDDIFPQVDSERLFFGNNLIYDIGASWGTTSPTAIWLTAKSSTLTAFEHNTVINNADKGTYLLHASGSFPGVMFENNLAFDQENGIRDDASARGTPTIAASLPGLAFNRNVLAGQDAQSYPGYFPGNYFPSNTAGIGFVSDPANGVFDEHSFALSPGSPFHEMASDGTDIGADINAIDSAFVRQSMSSGVK